MGNPSRPTIARVAAMADGQDSPMPGGVVLVSSTHVVAMEGAGDSGVDEGWDGDGDGGLTQPAMAAMTTKLATSRDVRFESPAVSSKQTTS
jgi:hypothetical protein